MARHRKPPRAQAEDDALRGRWAGLREQDALQAKFHSPAENHRARRRCRQSLRAVLMPWIGLSCWVSANSSVVQAIKKPRSWRGL